MTKLKDEIAALRARNAELETLLARSNVERDEALEQQTATAEVLGVINSSPGNLTPVFDAMLEKAERLCEAVYGTIMTFDGEYFATVAVHGKPQLVEKLRRLGRIRAQAGSLAHRLAGGERIVHIVDAADDDAYRAGSAPRRAVVEAGVRTLLGVALRKDGALVGLITLYREDVRPFSDKQIGLLDNFAAQAVIAMENARLITETREALEQQTATAEILAVINSSPGDLTPVFNSVLEKGLHLCGAAFGVLQVNDGDRFRTAATLGVPPAYAEYRRHHAFVEGPGSLGGRIRAGERVVHVLDLKDDEPYKAGDPNRVPLVDLGGARTGLAVPLATDRALHGFIIIYRQEVRPFSEKQISLLQNFAAQAVIAIENARLVNETREALEQQTATAEVLQVINSSPGDLAPVFDTMLEKAIHLCGASLGTLWTYDGEWMHPVASRGASREYAAYMTREPLRPGAGALGRLVRGEALLHVVDLKDTDAYKSGDPHRRALVDLGGGRSLVGVPLRTNEQLLGAFLIYRREPQPFTDKQIALLQNFAAQAVVAMENARLITETREALEQQTATADVLGVINSSPGDLAPVFDAMLEKAMRLCGAAFGFLTTYDGQHFKAAVQRGVPEQLAEYLAAGLDQPRSGDAHWLLLAGEDVVHNLDQMEEEAYRSGNPLRRAVVDFGGARTVLTVALRKDSKLLGSISAYRQEVRPFTDKQIGLLQNFAAQAVIAMENARLITETREALEQQTATTEVLQIINSSPGDLAPVFGAMLEKAARLCNAGFGLLWLYEADEFRAAAVHAVPAALADFVRKPIPAEDSASMRDIARGERLVHVPDLADSELYRSGNPARRAYVDLGGARTLVSVALRKDNSLLGALNIYRQDVRPFSDKQIKLVENFAAQAVIAMENARLITETREALEQQTATAEVLGVINSSPGDLGPVFDALLDRAMHLCGAAFGAMTVAEEDYLRTVATRGVPQAYRRFREQNPPRSTAPIARRILVGAPYVHTLDLKAEEVYQSGDVQRRALVDLGGARTSIAVALGKDGRVLGAIHIYRTEVQAFSEKQIALLQNFAAQAVIAMENARLITETREALEQQTATAEVLQIINSSPGDLTPVFDAVLERATLLCSAIFGHLQLYDGELLHPVAIRGEDQYVEWMRQRGPVKPPPGVPMDRLLHGESVVHIPNVREDASYKSVPLFRAQVDAGGWGSSLAVALRKDDATLGTITVFRQQVGPFSDKQIALLQNFAAQAVIAMENGRLIAETREALEQQTATAEVLGVINSSPGDLQPVFNAMLEKALHLCGAAFGILLTYDGDRFQHAALRSIPAAYSEFMREHPPVYGPGTSPGRLALGEPLVHVIDVKDSDSYRTGDLNRRAIADLAGARTLVAVPLRRDNALLGAIIVFRQEVRPFSEKQIAVLRNFAAQAVIAMENARLLNEIRQRQAELRVTFDNMGDGVVMFDENLQLAAWNRNFEELLDLSEEVLSQHLSYRDYLSILANRGEFGTVDIEAEVKRRLENTNQEFRQERTRPDGRVIEVRRNAVPDGGFVLIYSDITERKRSEAEIRAARDAAEAAYRDLKAAQANLVQAEKMASLGQLTAGIAHEIKNPLNFVNNFAGLSVELLDELKETAAPAFATLDEKDRADINETVDLLTGNLEKIAEHGRRADNIVRSMLEHSRGATGERRAVDLNALVEEALNLAYHGGRAQDQSFNVTLDRDYGPDIPPIELVPQDITRVCLNLFGNGFYAANKRQKEGSDPKFKPTFKVTTRDLGDAVEIRARDNGIGIPAEIQDKLFQPFFTTKPTGEGTGLGLSISYDIVTQQHGGTIEVDSRVGEFTEFKVRLPRPQTSRRASV